MMFKKYGCFVSQFLDIVGVKYVNPLMPTVAMWVLHMHPVPDRVKPSFVIFDIRAL